MTDSNMNNPPPNPQNQELEVRILNPIGINEYVGAKTLEHIADLELRLQAYQRRVEELEEEIVLFKSLSLGDHSIEDYETIKELKDLVEKVKMHCAVADYHRDINNDYRRACNHYKQVITSIEDFEKKGQ